MDFSAMAAGVTTAASCEVSLIDAATSATASWHSIPEGETPVPQVTLDTNSDGQVMPLDVLVVINGLNVQPGQFDPRLDVNLDGLNSPIDALLIINHLNSRRSLHDPELQLTTPSDTNQHQVRVEWKADKRVMLPAYRWRLITPNQETSDWSEQSEPTVLLRPDQVGDEGRYQIEVRPQDAGRFWYAIHRFTINVDRTPPVVQRTSPDLVSTTPTDITYDVDGESRSESVALSEGDNLIERSIGDAAGNTTDVRWMITLDSRPPVIHSVRGPNISRGPATISWEATDEGSGLAESRTRIRLEDGVFSNWLLAAEDSRTLDAEIAVDGRYEFQVQVRDQAGNWSDETIHHITKDTQKPTFANISVQPDEELEAPFIVISYEVHDSGQIELRELEKTLEVGENRVHLEATDAAGNVAERDFDVIRIDAEPPLPDELAAYRSTLIDKMAGLFAQGTGVSVEGLPFDVLGQDGAAEKTWSQPTSMGFRLALLGHLVTRRWTAPGVSPEQATAEALRLVESLLDIQSRFGWQGLLPWMRTTPTLSRDRNEFTFVDNQNLTTMAAATLGMLEEAGLHRAQATKQLAENIGKFLAAQAAGYSALYDATAGMYYQSYNDQTKSFSSSHVDRLGSEWRAGVAVVSRLFGQPSAAWENLLPVTGIYETSKGRLGEFLVAFDGGLFQASWPNLILGEHRYAIRALLWNTVLAHLDFAARQVPPLPGVLSAASTPAAGYTYKGKIGAPLLAETQDALETGVGSIYALASAYSLNPQAILRELQRLENTFPSLVGSFGFLDSARSDSDVNSRYLAIDHLSSLLGLLNGTHVGMKQFLQHRALAGSVDSLYTGLDVNVAPLPGEWPEPDLSPQEAELYSLPNSYDLLAAGTYNYSEWRNGVTVTPQADGTLRYQVHTPSSNARVGGQFSPGAEMPKYRTVLFEMRAVGTDLGSQVDVLLEKTWNNITGQRRLTLRSGQSQWFEVPIGGEFSETDVLIFEHLPEGLTFELRRVRFLTNPLRELLAGT